MSPGGGQSSGASLRVPQQSIGGRSPATPAKGISGRSQSTPTLSAKRFLAQEASATSRSGVSSAGGSSNKARSCRSDSTQKALSLPRLKATPSGGGGFGAGSPVPAETTQVFGAARASELLLEVAQMRHEEVEFFSERLVLLGGKEGEKIRRAFRTRAAELLSTATPQQLSKARHTLLVLHAADRQLEFDPWQQSDTWPTTAGAHGTRWQCPTRALEERVAFLAHKGVHDLSVLSSCHAVTSDLASRGFIREKVHEVVLSCIMKFIETEPLVELRKHAMPLAELAEKAPSVMAALERRLVRRLRQGLQPGRLSGFAQLVLDLQERGVAVLDGPGVPVVDTKIPLRVVSLRGMLLEAMQTSLKEHPEDEQLDRLYQRISGPEASKDALEAPASTLDVTQLDAERLA